MSELEARHEQAWLLLPWYSNGTLQGEEFRQVQSHLNTCLVCRQELARLHAQVSLVQEYDEIATPMEQSFHKLMGRIKADRRHGRNPAAAFADGLRRWLIPPRPAWVFSTVLAAVLVSGVFFFQDRLPSARYRTLSDVPSAPHGRAAHRPLRVVFDGALSLDAFNRILRECRVSISGGPNSVGAYTLDAGGEQHPALACLRGNDAVRFAEYASAGGGGAL